MADEARAMLDALMGADRNAALPEGTAVSKKRNHDGELSLRKRQKSCYDNDVDPLYCAWGVDVYELFVNTKSDIGPNPRKVDDGARAEFVELPTHEQERLGYHHMLFRKLSDLVRSCDRTVQRNKDKLTMELRRQNEKRGGGTPSTDHVTAVDPAALDALVRAHVQVERVEVEISNVVERLEAAKVKEEKLQGLVDNEQAAAAAAASKEDEVKNEADHDPSTEEETGQKDETTDEAQEGKDGVYPSTETGEKDTNETTPEIEDVDDAATAIAIATDRANGDTATGAASTNNKTAPDTVSGLPPPPPPSELDVELRQAIVVKQRLLFELARHIQQYAPLQERVMHETEQLQQVRSDITSDKTVCEVSGNFMSVRDADERIAAHYAGKQYVGWKLVRDKLKEMIEKYGRYGPPPPQQQRRDGYDGGPPRGGGSGQRFDGRGGGGRGGYHRRGPSPDRWERSGPRGGYGGGSQGYGGRGDRRHGGGGHRGGGRRW